MTPVELSRTVLHAVRRAVDDGELRVTVPARAVVTPPGPGGWGDYATNIALQLARPAGRPPLRVAEVLRPYLVGAEGVLGVEITGPGFLNIALAGTATTGVVRRILRDGPRYGHGDALAGQVLRLHAPHDVRALVVLDAAARLLRSQGARVRTSCDAAPEPAWAAVLDLHVDTHGVPDGSDGIVHGVPDGSDGIVHVVVRPIPASADPLPLARDAARWALLHPAPHDRPRVTPDHLVQRESNPLFRVRYAHARTRALTRNAADLGFTADPAAIDVALTGVPGTVDVALTGVPGTVDVAPTGVPGTVDAAPPGGPPAFPLPTSPDIAPLLTTLADHPRVLTAAATHRAPDRLARHLVGVADGVLPLLPAVLPRGAEKPSAAHRARLALAEAAGTVLAGGLSLLGIDAPDHL
ncbi:ArgS-related anticodon-binding protein NrtL [Streptomyces cinereospinus]|uniref:arginine--tRNA ligase n=1 Tax=Streptomyces cinereospinus TaxID=285561 RepID=A0ABV5MVB4_9ACTN